MSAFNDPARRRFLKLGVAASASASLPLSTEARTPSVRRYRRLGRTELEISDISFGSSRLRDDQDDLVRHALDRGINYFDSAHGYTGGTSEKVLGRVFEGMRQDVVLVSKVESSASWGKDRLMSHLDGSLRRLKTDYIDIYMCHAVNDIERIKSPEWQAFVDDARRAGKIRYVGMSGHAGRLIPCLDYALDEDMVDVVLVAYNFGQDPAFYEKLTRSFNYVAKQPDLPRVLNKARKQDVGVVAMKTLMGARLNDMRPYENGNATFAQAAFRWVLSNQDVDALIVTMRSRGDIDEYLGASGASALAADDMDLLFRYARLNGASYCRHLCDDCSGACPYGVQISDVLRTRMYAVDYMDMDFARDEYAKLDVNAAACLNCSGEPCRNSCTKGITVSDFCAPTHRMLV
ncbi:MAG: aldo/keto reductase [Gammaproteobacteria bacterium]